MESKIKKTVKAGNSSAVILPRAWLNKNVRSFSAGEDSPQRYLGTQLYYVRM